jgi:hypothetical protein
MKFNRTGDKIAGVEQMMLNSRSLAVNRKRLAPCLTRLPEIAGDSLDAARSCCHVIDK